MANPAPKKSLVNPPSLEASSVRTPICAKRLASFSSITQENASAPGMESDDQSYERAGKILIFLPSHGGSDVTPTYYFPVNLTEKQVAEELKLNALRTEFYLPVSETFAENIDRPEAKRDTMANLYMHLIRRMGRDLTGDALHAYLRAISQSIVAALGNGNYVFDATGTFPLPHILEDNTFTHFINYARAHYEATPL